MTPSKNGEHIAFYLSVAVAFVYAATRLGGVYLSDNYWSLDHWQHFSNIYIIVWFTGAIAAAFLLLRYHRFFAGLLDSLRNRLILTIGLMLLFFLFRFDSFLYGGGNHLMAQVAQSGAAVFRWYEIGFAAISASLFRLFSLFGMEATQAAYAGLRVYSLAGTVLALWAAVLLTRRMASDAPERFLVFIILFFGPQTLNYFGYVGFEPFLTAVIYWYALCAWELTRQYTTGRLLLVWGVTIAGALIHISMVLLLPATLFLTLGSTSRLSGTFVWLSGLTAWMVLVAAAYIMASGNLEVARVILFPQGGNLQPTYNLFSARHLGDMVQLLLLVFPQVLVLAYLFWSRWAKIKSHAFMTAMILTALGGMTVVFVSEPLHSIVLDTPHLAGFMTPLALLLAALLAVTRASNPTDRRLLIVLAVLAQAIPTSVLPAYTKIKTADGYVENYLTRNSYYFMEAGIAFRDAYFFDRDFDRANRWEWKLPTSSEDFLQLKAAKENLAAEQYPSAVALLYQIIAKNPYRTEPRRLLANVQIKLKQFSVARAQIDTCLMLEPYGKDVLMLQYGYFRDVGDYASAQIEALRASEIFPSNNEIKSDLAIYYFRAGNMIAADSLSAFLIEADSSLPFPYVIRGFIAEGRQNPAAAIEYYKKFIALAPDEPETPQIRKRLNELILRQQPTP